MADLLVSRWGDILLNRPQLDAVLQTANEMYREDPWNFSGHGISHLFPLTIEKLAEAYEQNHIKLYLDGWLGSLCQVCIIPRPFRSEETQGMEWFTVSMDDGWVDENRNRTLSALGRILNTLQ